MRGILVSDLIFFGFTRIWPRIDLVLTCWTWPGLDLDLTWTWPGLDLNLTWTWPRLDLDLTYWCYEFLLTNLFVWNHNKYAHDADFACCHVTTEMETLLQVLTCSLEAPPPLGAQYRPLQPGVETLYPGVDPRHPRPPATNTETDNAHL